MRTARLFSTGIVALAAMATARAVDIDITIENTQPSGYFYFTPFWVASHNGGFDSYDGGDFAAGFPGITEIAEVGNTGPISAAFSASAAGAAGGAQDTITAVSGPGDAPVFGPGESQTVTLDIGDATVNRYFSYASMVVPSNDLFVANGNPLAHELFDAAGNFLGPVTINLFGSSVNDNGTETNSAVNDAAFSALDGQSLPENVVVRNFFTAPGDADYLDSFVGTQVATGDTITGAFGADTLIGRITITPEPGSLALLAGLLPLALRRRY